MGKLAKIVGGIKARLGRKRKKEKAAAAACYDKVEKTDSMRVEMRSRRAQELIAKTLADPAADAAGGGKKGKKQFLVL